MGSAWLGVAAGLALLVAGAESLVRGSVTLARRLGVSQLVIGLTVVAFGTSAPELVVSLRAALAGEGDIAAGNVVGSNIANILLILGLAVAIRPLALHLRVVRLDIPLMIGVTLVALPVLGNRFVGRIEGLALMAGIVAYSWLNVRLARRGPAPEGGREPAPPAVGRHAIAGSVLAVVLGLGALALGADLLVKGAVAAAGALGVSKAVVGLTVVAIGTSLPEMATSLVAALRRQSDIAVGNVVGSNIFNLLAILGASALARPLRLSGIGWTDVLVMLAAAALLLPLARTGARLSRWEGLLFLAGYALYVLYRSGALGFGG